MIEPKTELTKLKDEPRITYTGPKVKEKNPNQVEQGKNWLQKRK